MYAIRSYYGGMMLSFYGYMERDRALPKWNNSVNKGKKNPFDTYAGYTGSYNFV